MEQFLFCPLLSDRAVVISSMKVPEAVTETEFTTNIKSATHAHSAACANFLVAADCENRGIQSRASEYPESPITAMRKCSDIAFV